MIKLEQYRKRLAKACERKLQIETLILEQLQIIPDILISYLAEKLTHDIFNSRKRNIYFIYREYFNFPTEFLADYLNVSSQTVSNGASIVRTKYIKNIKPKDLFTPKVVEEINSYKVDVLLLKELSDLQRQIPRLKNAIKRRELTLGLNG